MKVRKQVLAGSWYPGTKQELSTSTERYYEAVAEDTEKVRSPESRKIIVPHAGHVYSGQCAAYGYETLTKNFSKALILCPSHRAFFQDIALSSDEAFETPFGTIPVHTESVKELAESRFFSFNDDAHFDEHAIEIQLPFLQSRFPDISIIPLIVGHMKKEYLREAAQELMKIIDDKTVIIISSDFTHYGENFDYLPFRDNVKENIYKLDGEAIEYILKKDPEGFIQYVNKTEATICGRNPISILLEMLEENEKGELLKYYTSGDVTGDYHHSVSYASIAFT